MSSSNIQSTLDFLSSTGISPILPSLSELLAQERLTKFIRPCLGHILKTLGRFHPLSNLVKILYQYKDEFILLIESIIQWFYLHSYSALVGEHFYGLKRTADHRLRSLIFSVFLPYIKLKIDSLHKQMHTNSTNRHITYYMMLQLLPKIQILIDGINWLYRLSYAFGLTKYYSPTLQLANVKLTYAKDPSPTIPNLSSSRQFLSVISQIISNGLFVIQLIDWWNSSKQNSLNQIANQSLPVIDRKRSIINGKHQCPLCQQPCNIPTVIIGSSYVYCYTCINDYVKQYNRCPVSNQPVTSEHLFKIY
ncbi:unnamed protein product [Rotaria socialis]|uniref:Peroxisome assembly protein 12 n=1 Tax=Rotaria socialis TaxID=392032 RepID=A0A821NFS3_9BILA|nr:unnamed protein product [Rotaria socialis]CAF3366264.1 unnamed protein product [Rotaria socialis]CAF3468263.1 unnamed protein product [Rotaria socialis]CAF3498423.1 unnamed protein product [Rotaria socialis]CAF3695031.1 unnamed protein product [Rotaria socialis]